MKLSFFGPKMAVSWRICVFQKKKFAETPIFIVFFGCALFGAKLSKKGNFGHPHQKRRKFSLITEKLIFEYFCFFLFFSLFLSFFCFFVLFFFWCFFWRVEGSCEVARRATSLGPKPSLFVFLFLFCFCFFVFFFGFFLLGGFKGQVRWPEGPPHLALNPPYLFVVFLFFGCFLFSFWFLSFLCFNRKTCFSP